MGGAGRRACELRVQLAEGCVASTWAKLELGGLEIICLSPGGPQEEGLVSSGKSLQQDVLLLGGLSQGW
jgi:hypothetical protein